MKPESTYFEDEHRHLFGDAGVEIIIERFRRNRDGDLIADVQPREALGDGWLPSEKLNLSSARSIKSYAKTLAERPLQGEIDWFDLLGRAAAESEERLRTGEPHIWLRDVDLANISRWLIEPFIVDRAISMIYGAGGSAKSVFALVLAIVVASGRSLGGMETQAQGPVLVLDWEDDAETWTERQRAICAAADIDEDLDIAYMRMTTSLHEAAREVRKRIATIGARFVIVDSVGMASGGDPNDAGLIMRTLLAARSLGVPVLVIHHIAKDAKDPLKSGPYGSVYSQNEVRQSWYIATEQPEGSNEATMVFANAKPNRSARVARQGFRLVFEDEGGLLDSIVVSTSQTTHLPSDDTSKSSQRWELLRWLMDEGQQTYKAMAGYLDTSEARVRGIVRANPQMFAKSDTKPILVSVISDRSDDTTDVVYPGTYGVQRPKAGNRPLRALLEVRENNGEDKKVAQEEEVQPW